MNLHGLTCLAGKAHARGIFFFSLRPEPNIVQGFASNFSLYPLRRNVGAVLRSKNKLPLPKGQGIPSRLVEATAKRAGKFVSDRVPTLSERRFIPAPT